MSIPKMTNDLAVIQKLSDLPNSTDGLTAAQLKAKFDEAPQAVQKWLNEVLVPSIHASRIPFAASTEIDAQTIEAAIHAVHRQVRDAAAGTIVNGSVGKEKLSEALLNRVYGGRAWVSLDTPGESQNVDRDFPIGQLWLRPGFTVVNAAGTSWATSGCTVTVEENRMTVTGNQTVATVSATQTLTGVGQAGDRVYVLLGTENRDPELTALTVSLNGGTPQDLSGGVFTTVLSGDSLTVELAAGWPSTSLAGGSFELVNYTVVNADQVLRQTLNAADLADWPAYLAKLLPLSCHVSPETVYMQVHSGVWWPISSLVQPVSRGGTGLDHLAAGELLCGSGAEQMQKVAAGEDGMLLRFKDGAPQWHTMEQVITDGGVLRIQTGSYRGNGGIRTIQLGLTPIALLISPDEGDDFGVLLQGSHIHKTFSFTSTSGAIVSYTAGMELSGENLTATVSTRFGAAIEGSEAKFLNESGEVYYWAAIY